MNKFKLVFRPETPPIAWGKPDSPRRLLCAICHGALDDIPLMMWSDAGFAASLCERCVDLYIESVEHKP